MSQNEDSHNKDIREMRAKILAIFDQYGHTQYFFGFYDRKDQYDKCFYSGGDNYLKGCASDILEGISTRSQKEWTSPEPIQTNNDDEDDQGEEWRF